MVHTKIIRNKLSYDKLYKLVSVHYNLNKCTQEKNVQQQEVDPCAMMLDATLCDEKNPIWDWLDKSMSDVDICPSQLDKSARGRHGKTRMGRGREWEEEDIEFLDSETENEEELEDGFSDDDEEGARVNSGDLDSGDEPAETSPTVQESIEGPNGRRSGRIQKKRIQNLY